MHAAAGRRPTCGHRGRRGDPAGRKGCDEKGRSRESGARRTPTSEEPQTQAWELVAAERRESGSPEGPGTQVMGLGWGAGCPRQTGLGEFIRTETTSILKVSSVLN